MRILDRKENLYEQNRMDFMPNIQRQNKNENAGRYRT